LAPPHHIPLGKKNLTNYVNKIAYPEDHIFEIEAVHENEPYTNGFVNSLHTGNLKFDDLEHGMRIKNGQSIKKITKDVISDKESFYYLHITKTSGIAVQSELKNVFKEYRTFVNSIQHLDEEDMLKSKLISGHFAMYPFLLYKNNNKKINGITIIRNPIDRAISYFIFKYKITDSIFGFKTKNLTSKNFDTFLSDQVSVDHITNYQTKTMTSSLDLNKSFLWSNKYLEKECTRFDLTAAQVINYNFMDLSNNESLWKDSLNNFSIIGSVEHREMFLKETSDFLQKKGYEANLKNVVKNKSDFNVEEIKKILTKEQINKIVELNEYDFELYDFVMSNRGVLKC
jgi:hypothetical protein